MVLDLDYRPDKDESGGAKKWRDETAKSFIEMGLPAFESSSGNGYHFLVRVEDIQWKNENLYEPFPNDLPGVKCEIFPPGYKRHVVIDFSRGVANNKPGSEIPRRKRLAIMVGFAGWS